MPDFNVVTAAGSAAGSVSGPDHLFGIEPNVSVMHQVVTAQLAGKRQGTHSTKTRAEVSGGGAKPWRQKGTGRARQGSIRAPHWRGGGAATGPKPRDYGQRTPKKMIRLALASALSDRAADDKLRVVDDWGLDAPKTKAAIALLENLDVYGRILVVVDRDDDTARKSFNNLTGVDLLSPDQLNTYDVLVSDFVIFSKSSFEATCEARPGAVARKEARAASLEAKVAAGASAIAATATDVGDDSAEQPEALAEAASNTEEEE